MWYWVSELSSAMQNRKSEIKTTRKYTKSPFFSFTPLNYYFVWKGEETGKKARAKAGIKDLDVLCAIRYLLRSHIYDQIPAHTHNTLFPPLQQLQQIHSCFLFYFHFTFLKIFNWWTVPITLGGWLACRLSNPPPSLIHKPTPQ